MSTATVFDFTPAQLRRTVGKKPSETSSAEASFSIFDDLADGIEAIHQCANLAGFTERPRSFIFALATAAHSQSTSCIELFDEELAKLQNCSPRTVQRQRKDYLKESRPKNFDFVEIIEGEFDSEKNRNKPTLYRFHLGDVVERIVSEARSSDDWHETDRRKQRAALKRAASNVYDEIPEAPPKTRNNKGSRLATSEIKTYQKIIKTTFGNLKNKASKLPPGERERLMNAVDPGELHGWWLQLRAEMDGFFNVDSPQTAHGKEDNRGTRQLVVPPPVTEDAEEAEHAAADEAEPVVVHTFVTTTTDPEALAAWERLEERLTTPQIRRVEVELSPTEPPPPQVDEEPSAAPTFGMTDPETAGEQDWELDPVEQAEAEASNLSLELEYHADEPEPVAAFELGAMVYPCTSDGVLLHAEPSPIAERRLTASGWQYRLDGFTQWRDESLYAAHMQFLE